MFAPGVPEVMQEFHNSSEIMASFVVAIYILGESAGEIQRVFKLIRCRLRIWAALGCTIERN